MDSNREALPMARETRLVEEITLPDLQIYQSRSSSLYERVAALKLANDEAYVLCTDLLKEAKRIHAAIEDEFMKAKQPSHQAHKAIVALEKKALGPFIEIWRLAEEKMKLYPTPPKVEGVSFPERWTGDVVDETMIPREFMTPDLEKLKKRTQECKAETRIPGWRPRLEKSITVRS